MKNNFMSHLWRTIVGVLPQKRLLRVHGRDSVKFLQGLFTNDIHGLKRRGDVCYGAFLTHKGRILGDADILHMEVQRPLSSSLAQIVS
jgi:folate-binding Fe-S cluster repair protein YgfZ